MRAGSDSFLNDHNTSQQAEFMEVSNQKLWDTGVDCYKHSLNTQEKFHFIIHCLFDRVWR